MSAYGYKRTFCQTLIYVRFTPESRHLGTSSSGGSASPSSVLIKSPEGSLTNGVGLEFSEKFLPEAGSEISEWWIFACARHSRADGRGVMSALPPKADLFQHQHLCLVLTQSGHSSTRITIDRFRPKVEQRAKPYSMARREELG